MPMKISDAKPGDVLVDAAGAKWLVTSSDVRCIYEPSMSPPEYHSAPGDRHNPDAAERFGPFTLLVPEKEEAP